MKVVKNRKWGFWPGCVLALMALLAASGFAQADPAGREPLCVMEIWTDRQAYHPGDRVQVNFWISVNDSPELPEITDAQLELELQQPFGPYIMLSSKKNVSLRKGIEWEETLLTLPVLGDLLRDLGDYSLHAMLRSQDGGLLCEAYASFTIRSMFGQRPTTRTLLVTSRRTQLTEPFASMLAAWLEACFKTQVQVIYQEGFYEAYQAGAFQGFDVIIYYATDFTQGPPPDLVVDIFEGEGITKKKVVWIGYHLDKVQGYLHLYGLKYGELRSASDLTPLHYVDGETDYMLLNADRISVEPVNPDLARVRATADGLPIIVSARHTYYPEDGECFYFVGFHPTAYLAPFGAHLVFLDVLSEAYGIEHPRAALVRLEDVHARTNGGSLLAAAEYLDGEGVPFSLALIPIYSNGQGEEIRLSQDRQFRITVKRALLSGGELVLHGASHQYDGETAIDYEFWDEARMAPVGGREYAEDRLTLAMEELEASGLKPYLVAWETPHYRASTEAYAIFESHFPLIYEDPHWGFNLRLLPYPVETESALYVPTNLGYVARSSLRADVDRILEQARLLAGLQHGALASFFYHPELGLAALKEIIAGLKGQGWTFQPVSFLLGN
ncbi:DUF2334 domain-containing protein [Candidatus Bipolaricaulota bacterium]|nr:DUF2334 domain-containing protein [Candidatus Bipolaricaulota bacterium]